MATIKKKICRCYLFLSWSG